MDHAGRLSKLDGLTGGVTFYEEPNKERLRTMYKGDIRNIQMDISFPDPRRFTPKQKNLMFALFNNVSEWSLQDLGNVNQDIPIDYIGCPKTIKDKFYSDYILKFQKDISVKNIATTTVSEMNDLLELIIEFMFEWNVPFKEGYELLPKNEQFYLYQCLKHRKCAVCGRHADIHHEGNKVGAGNNRNTYDHTQSTFIALCRRHHVERHTQTWNEFKKIHILEAIKLDKQALIALGLISNKQMKLIEGKKELKLKGGWLNGNEKNV